MGPKSGIYSLNVDSKALHLMCTARDRTYDFSQQGNKENYPLAMSKTPYWYLVLIYCFINATDKCRRSNSDSVNQTTLLDNTVLQQSVFSFRVFVILLFLL